MLRARTLSIVTAVFLALPLIGATAKAKAAPGAAYTMSNATSGNQILVFNRGSGGTLTAAGSFATGGMGTGGGLGNQGAPILSGDERWLLAANAGSHTLSVFAVDDDGLHLVGTTSSGGLRPVSITIHRRLVYVLNAGSDTIQGFRLSRDGALSALPGATRALSGAGTGPAEVAFTPDGDLLIVTEKKTNLIDTFAVDDDGIAGLVQSQPSHGATPFGFAFGKRDQVFISEAFGGAPGASAVSSYNTSGGSLDIVSASVPTNQTAACWVVVTPEGRFAYASNTDGDSISGYEVDHRGRLALLDPDGRTGDTGAGSTPIDLAISGNGRFLYSLNSATHTIGAFEVKSNGRLVGLPFTGGLPAGANGLAAR